MRRFCRFIIVIAIGTVVFSILIGGANGIGASRLVDTGIEDGTGFGMCQLPCWAGITPGITPIADVIGLLDAIEITVSPQTFNEGVFFTLDNPTTILEGSVYGDHRGIVNLIRLSGHIPIPYLFRQLGQPDCALYPNPSEAITVIWQRERITMFAIVLQNSFGELVPDGNAPLFNTYFNGIECTQPETLPWLGFVPSWRYIQQLNDNP